MTVFVSDHAVLRWLERSAGLDVERSRIALASPAADCAAEIHCHTVILPDGCRLVLRGDVVRTCLPSTKHRRPRLRDDRKDHRE